MKVALVHDYLKEYGGAERVLEALHDIFPDAPIYTSVYLPAFLGPHKERFKNYRVKTSWAQYIPFKAKLISPLRLLSPLLFRSFDFSEFDVVITSATNGQVLAFNGTNWINQAIAASTFLSLTDTPSSYSGSGSNIIAVNAGATGLEFVNTIDGGTF